jgi:magnesium-dependent phosphatase-1
LANKHPITLVVFDGDDTLWVGLDGGYISGANYLDPGRDDFTFQPLDALQILRNDGQRFRLYPEVPAVLAALDQRGVLISLASYNHAAPTLNAIQNFGIAGWFRHPVVVWSNQKDRMLREILDGLAADGFPVKPENTLFIDDDMTGSYRRQMASIGVQFLQKEVDISNLADLLDHPRYELVPMPLRSGAGAPI